MSDALTRLAVESPSRDAAFNLALEECLLRSAEKERAAYFLLWQNEPAVIIGRHQIASEVANLDAAQNLNVPLYRRASGGGAVYHDGGALNFSFLTPGTHKIDFAPFLSPVLAALADLGINAEISGRNDLEINGKKICGCAQYLSSAHLHHGVLAVNLDLALMEKLLRANKAKYLSKGVKSVAARVLNLGEEFNISVPDLKKSLIKRCANRSGEIPMDIVTRAKSLAAEKYASDKWNYGDKKIYNFEKHARFPWGEIKLDLRVRDNQIIAAKITGDFFSEISPRIIEEKLTGINYNSLAAADALAAVDWPRHFAGCDPDEIREFFTRALFTERERRNNG